MFATIEARIRRAFRYSAGMSNLARQFLATDPQRSERPALALRLLDERADLVGFALSSRLRGAARASTLVREGLRRALFEVLFRQTEFNRASGELIREHEWQLEALGATVRAQLELQTDAEKRLDALERQLAPPGLAVLGLPAFGERVGGTAQERRERLRKFVSRFEGRSDVIDAGCGRGDFLELLREANIDAVGIDRDEAMIDRCRELGLDATHADVIQFLSSQPEESHGGLFGGHLVESLQRGEIVKLVRLGFSRLRPGGVLVIEAVNPSCLLTYASFYNDLTRVAPVPPLALQWLTESCGFVSVSIDYHCPVSEEHKLRELPMSTGAGADVEAFNRGVATANEVLFGFQEYSLTAHKPA